MRSWFLVLVAVFTLLSTSVFSHADELAFVDHHSHAFADHPTHAPDPSDPDLHCGSLILMAAEVAVHFSPRLPEDFGAGETAGTVAAPTGFEPPPPRPRLV